MPVVDCSRNAAYKTPHFRLRPLEEFYISYCGLIFSFDKSFFHSTVIPFRLRTSHSLYLRLVDERDWLLCTY